MGVRVAGVGWGVHVPFLQGVPSRPDPHHAQDGEEDDDGQAGICAVGTGVDIWVPLLIELQHAEASNHVHERGIWVGTACELQRHHRDPKHNSQPGHSGALECHQQAEGSVL